jgi:hypothetical protein
MSAWSSRSSSLTALASLEGLAPVCVLSETARQISRLVRTCDIALLLRHLTQFRYHAAWREPPVSFGVAPAEIVEGHVGSILRIEVTVTDDNGTRTGHLASQTEIRAAAEWAWIIFRDLFGEYPPTGDEDGYHALVHKVLEVRRPYVVERLPPLS